MKSQKTLLRNEIKKRKKQYHIEDLNQLSEQIMGLLVYEPAFSQAETVLLYYSLPDEVNTHLFIKHWSQFKKIILPVVIGDILELRVYSGDHDLHKGAFGIWEPCGELYINYNDIDVAIIPGVAFDKYGNRLGRGKGYYDKLLPLFDTYKIGVCFPFQYKNETVIPTEPTDISMNKVLTLHTIANQ